ncbi:unnamed protein product, partial [Ascophyllum nodosum]
FLKQNPPQQNGEQFWWRKMRDIYDSTCTIIRRAISFGDRDAIFLSRNRSPSSLGRSRGPSGRTSSGKSCGKCKPVFSPRARFTCRSGDVAMVSTESCSR